MNIPKISQNSDAAITTIITDASPQPSYGRSPNLYTKILTIQRRTHFITIPQTTQDFNQLAKVLQNISKNLRYSVISKELHQDGNVHYHIALTFKSPIYISQIHNKILSVEGNIGGSINYQEAQCLQKVITYIKKDGCFIETGEAPKQAHNKVNKIDKVNDDLSLIYNDLTLSTEQALITIKEKQPAYYTQHQDKIKAVLEQQHVTPKWDYIQYTSTNTKLKPYQQKVWDLINQPPVSRRIIWVYGKPNTGKSFLFNYINDNYKYRLYSAGSSASIDNVVYGYDEEGVIAWDLPKSYDFTTLGDTLASTIEKFSDFGQVLTSKKYNGKKVRVLGHCIVFSNSPPIQQLLHRDILLINTHNIVTKTIDDKEIHQIIDDDGNTRYYYSQQELDDFITNH